MDPTELGSYLSSTSCPACPQEGYLLPSHVTLEKEREEEQEEQQKREEEEAKRKAAEDAERQMKEQERKKQAEEAKAAKDDSDDDLDDLLDDICVHPEMFRKPEPKVTDEQVEAAGQKYNKAKEDDVKTKKRNDKWFTNCNADADGEKREDEEEEEEEDGKFSFYKVPWHCDSCGMNVAGDQVPSMFPTLVILKCQSNIREGATLPPLSRSRPC